MFCTWIVKKSKLSLFGTFAPRGWISRLKKIPRPWHLTLTYLSQYSRRWYSEKNIFQTQVFFLQTCKYRFFGKKYKGIKMPRGWISRLKKSHDLEICTRPTCRGTLGDGIRQKNSPTGSIFFSNLQYRVFLEKKYKDIKMPRGWIYLA